MKMSKIYIVFALAIQVHRATAVANVCATIHGDQCTFPFNVTDSNGAVTVKTECTGGDDGIAWCATGEQNSWVDSTNARGYCVGDSYSGCGMDSTVTDTFATLQAKTAYCPGGWLQGDPSQLAGVTYHYVVDGASMNLAECARVAAYYVDVLGLPVSAWAHWDGIKAVQQPTNLTDYCYIFFGAFEHTDLDADHSNAADLYCMVPPQCEEGTTGPGTGLNWCRSCTCRNGKMDCNGGRRDFPACNPINPADVWKIELDKCLEPWLDGVFLEEPVEEKAFCHESHFDPHPTCKGDEVDTGFDNCAERLEDDGWNCDEFQPHCAATCCTPPAPAPYDVCAAGHASRDGDTSQAKCLALDGCMQVCSNSDCSSPSAVAGTCFTDPSRRFHDLVVADVDGTLAGLCPSDYTVREATPATNHLPDQMTPAECAAYAGPTTGWAIMLSALLAPTDSPADWANRKDWCYILDSDDAQRGSTTQDGSLQPTAAPPPPPTSHTGACSSSPCQNGATCNNVGESFSCACTDGWTGSECSLPTPCSSSSPCQNGATCNDVCDDSFSCTFSCTATTVDDRMMSGSGLERAGFWCLPPTEMKYVKRFDGECKGQGPEDIKMFSGCHYSEPQHVLADDNPGTTREEHIEECAKVCFDKGSNGEFPDNWHLRGFVLIPSTGRCWCTETNAMTCEVISKGRHEHVGEAACTMGDNGLGYERFDYIAGDVPHPTCKIVQDEDEVTKDCVNKFPPLGNAHGKGGKGNPMWKESGCEYVFDACFDEDLAAFSPWRNSNGDSSTGIPEWGYVVSDTFGSGTRHFVGSDSHFGNLYDTPLGKPWNTVFAQFASLADCQSSRAANSCRVNGPTDEACNHGKNTHCVFPFQYNGKMFTGCTDYHNDGVNWCATTSDFDKDAQWGLCVIPPTPPLTPTYSHPMCKGDEVDTGFDNCAERLLEDGWECDEFHSMCEATCCNGCPLDTRHAATNSSGPSTPSTTSSTSTTSTVEPWVGFSGSGATISDNNSQRKVCKEVQTTAEEFAEMSFKFKELDGWDNEGEMYFGSDDLEFFDDGGEQMVGLQFEPIAIEPNARVISAYITFEDDSSGNNNFPLSAKIWAEHATKPELFGDTYFDMTQDSRSRTEGLPGGKQIWEITKAVDDDNGTNGGRGAASDPANCPHGDADGGLATCWANSAYNLCPGDRQAAHDAVLASAPVGANDAMHAKFLELMSTSEFGCWGAGDAVVLLAGPVVTNFPATASCQAEQGIHDNFGIERDVYLANVDLFEKGRPILVGGVKYYINYIINSNRTSEDLLDCPSWKDAVLIYVSNELDSAHHRDGKSSKTSGTIETSLSAYNSAWRLLVGPAAPLSTTAAPTAPPGWVSECPGDAYYWRYPEETSDPGDACTVGRWGGVCWLEDTDECVMEVPKMNANGMVCRRPEGSFTCDTTGYLKSTNCAADVEGLPAMLKCATGITEGYVHTVHADGTSTNEGCEIDASMMQLKIGNGTTFGCGMVSIDVSQDEGSYYAHTLHLGGPGGSELGQSCDANVRYLNEYIGGCVAADAVPAPPAPPPFVAPTTRTTDIGSIVRHLVSRSDWNAIDNRPTFFFRRHSGSLMGKRRFLSRKQSITLTATVCALEDIPECRVEAVLSGDEGNHCVFPFTYKGFEYLGCTDVENDGVPWCATTDNYAKDQHWGVCASTTCPVQESKPHPTCLTGNPGPLLSTAGYTLPTCKEGAVDSFSNPGCAERLKDDGWNCDEFESMCEATCCTPPGSLTESDPAPNGTQCVFPFVYQNVSYNGCTKVHNHGLPWCATVANYDETPSWGYCEMTPLTKNCQSLGQVAIGDDLDCSLVFEECYDDASYDDESYWGYIVSVDRASKDRIFISDSSFAETDELQYRDSFGTELFRYVKRFDGECEEGSDTLQYSGCYYADLNQSVHHDDNPGTTPEENIAECALACNQDAGFKGFEVIPSTGRCWCSDADGLTCTAESSRRHDGTCTTKDNGAGYERFDFVKAERPPPFASLADCQSSRAKHSCRVNGPTDEACNYGVDVVVAAPDAAAACPIHNGAWDWHCNDGIRNGDETWTDCGGVYCDACDPHYIKRFDGECEERSEVGIFEGCAHSYNPWIYGKYGKGGGKGAANPADRSLTTDDNPGNDEESNIQACAMACQERVDPFSGDWDDVGTPLGFVIIPSTGRCWCEADNADECSPYGLTRHNATDPCDPDTYIDGSGYERFDFYTPTTTTPTTTTTTPTVKTSSTTTTTLASTTPEPTTTPLLKTATLPPIKFAGKDNIAGINGADADASAANGGDGSNGNASAAALPAGSVIGILIAGIVIGLLIMAAVLAAKQKKQGSAAIDEADVMETGRQVDGNGSGKGLNANPRRQSEALAALSAAPRVALAGAGGGGGVWPAYSASTKKIASNEQYADAADAEYAEPGAMSSPKGIAGGGSQHAYVEFQQPPDGTVPPLLTADYLEPTDVGEETYGAATAVEEEDIYSTADGRGGANNYDSVAGVGNSYDGIASTAFGLAPPAAAGDVLYDAATAAAAADDVTYDVAGAAAAAAAADDVTYDVAGADATGGASAAPTYDIGTAGAVEVTYDVGSAGAPLFAEPEYALDTADAGSVLSIKMKSVRRINPLNTLEREQGYMIPGDLSLQERRVSSASSNGAGSRRGSLQASV